MITGSVRVFAVVFALAVALASHPASHPMAAGQTPDVTVMPIASDGQVQVTFDLSDGFTPDVRDAISSGLPTTFVYDVELRRDTAGWFDRTLSSVTVTATVHFDNLTRRYQMSRTLDSHAEDAPSAEDEGAVRRWMTHFDRIPVSTTSALETNGEYYVLVRAYTRPRNTWSLWPWDRDAVFGHARFTFIP